VARRRWTIGLNQSLPVLAPCSLGCSGTARHDPAPAGTSRHDRPRRASSEGPTGALPMIGGFPAVTANRAGARRLSRRVPAGSGRGPMTAARDTRPIRRSRRSLLTSGRCQRAPLAQLAEQRTLNPRVRGSSPWRRTRTDLGFYRSRSFFSCPFCPHVCSMFARVHGPSNPGLVKNGHPAARSGGTRPQAAPFRTADVAPDSLEQPLRTH
jgi:hypothetical protein